eukprot:GGOE01005662.1.p1 GENE.GGOE01005662.1~~GGOE01005662.1.p1  ORF type:complete len:373 (+),score=93.26 GGOE01005662.1:501-1619(+)
MKTPGGAVFRSPGSPAALLTKRWATQRHIQPLFTMRSSSETITRAVAHYTSTGRPQSLYRSCGLVFLSARPHLYKDYGGEGHFFKNVIDPLESRQELYTFTALIPGNLTGGMWHVLLTALGRAGPESWRRVAMDKKRKLQQFSCLYPECGLVFVGDNGQGDLLAAELIVEELGGVRLRPSSPSSPDGPPKRTGQMLGSFIHEVEARGRTLMDSGSYKAMNGRRAAKKWAEKQTHRRTALGSTNEAHLPPEAREEAYKAKGIHHFKTYVGAGLIAYRLGLIGPKALKRITAEAVLDFRSLEARRSPGKCEKGLRVKRETWGSWDWTEAQQHLQADISAVALELEIEVPTLGDATMRGMTALMEMQEETVKERS